MTAVSIKDALAKLDVSNDNHWTSDGLPRLDALKALTGDQLVTRDVVNAAFPGFSRTAPQGSNVVPLAVAPAGTAVSAPAAAAVVQPTVTAPPAPVVPVKTPPPVAKSEEEKESELAAAEDELVQANTRLADIDKYLADGQKARRDAVAAIEAADKKVQALRPSDTNVDAIQAYLARQRQTLAARGAQIAAAQVFQKEHGIKLSDLVPKKAPIDAAMARKNTRGTGRPGGK